MSGRSQKGTRTYGGSGAAGSLSGMLNKNLNKFPGFPWEGKFQTTKEIDIYLSGNTITCLMCGHEKKSLSKHLAKHTMDVKEYKIRFNIPMGYALQASYLSQIQSETMKDNNNKEDPENAAIRIQKLREAGRVAATGRDRTKLPSLTQELMYKGTCGKRGKQKKREHLELVTTDCTVCGALHTRSGFTAKRNKRLCPTCADVARKESYRKYGATGRKRLTDKTLGVE